MSVYTSILPEAFEARKCPLSNALFLGRKFLLPNYRAPDYHSQDELNKMALINLLLLTMPESKTKVDEVTRGAVCNVMLAASCGRPTLFLEKELGAILLDSHLPQDLLTEDIKKPFPSLRVMLPLGLLTIERSGVSSMTFLDIGFMEAEQQAACPSDIALELDRNSLAKFGAGDRYALSELAFAYDEAAFIISGALNKGETQLAPTAYGITKPWRPGPVSGLREFRGTLRSSWPTDQSDEVLMAKMENLALNILLLLSRVPLEYEPLAVERKARTEGKRIIPALLRAKWVGDCLLRARKEGHIHGELGNGYHVSPHWTRAHWRNQPHGPGRNLRRLIWILPYYSGEKKEAA